MPIFFHESKYMNINFFLAGITIIYAIAAHAAEQTEIIQLHPDRWQEYKQLRLKAIMQEPLAFGMFESDVSDKSENYWRTIVSDAFAQNNRWLVCAQHDGKLVGMVAAFPEYNSFSMCKHLAIVSSLYVIPEYREQGIATQLMKELFTLLEKSNSITHVFLWVTETEKAAIQLYKKLGFGITGSLSQSVKYNNNYYGMYLMERGVKNQQTLN